MSEERIERTQLDRIEKSLEHVDSRVGQVLERMARVEERQDNLGAMVESHRIKLDAHENRLSAAELHQAVQERTQSSDAQRSDGRWSGVGAVGLILMGGLLSFIAYLVIQYMENL